MIQRESSTARARPGPDSSLGPVRTCVGCRKRALAVDLLRTTAVDNGSGSVVVTVDAAGNLPGRGAWLHPDERCLAEAIRRRAFIRALRITGTPDTTAVVEYVSSLTDSVPSATDR